MNTNNNRTKVFHKLKTQDYYDQQNRKSKDPSWKKDQRQQQKRNWND